MKLLGVNAGTTVCRTVDKVDIFGDNSGVALYRLDGNANDESGNYHGTETAVTYGGGVYERGAVFNGTSSLISIPDTNQFDLDSFTVSLWCKFSTSQDNTTMFSNYYYNGSDDTGFLIRTLTNKIQVFSTGTVTTGTVDVVATVGTYNDSVWHHVVAIYSSNVLYLYVDGALVGSIGTTIRWTGALPTIGCRYTPSASQFFNGSIDQVRIFNRAITATEVATLYAECAPTSIVSVDSNILNQAVAHYKLDGNALDSTSNYNGTAASMTYTDGRFGQAGVFNGSTSMSTIPQTFISTTTDNTTFSFSLWVKFNALPDATYYKTIFYSSTVDGYAPVRLMVRYVSAGLFSIDIARLYNTTIYYNTAVATNVPLATGTFFHLVFTYGIGRTVSLYKDGVALATNVSLGSSASVSGTTIYQTLGLGQYAPIGTNNYSNYSLNGSIDQVRIYNKALTASDVTALYNEVLPASTVDTVQPLADTSVKAFYKFNGDATDATGTYNGIATNVTYGAGKFGQGITPTVSTGKVDIGYPLSALNNDISISIWAKMSSIPTVSSGGSYLFVAYGGNFRIVIDSTQKIAFGIYDGTDRVISSTTTPATNTWYHITIVRSKTLGMRLYVDGKLEASNSITVNPTVFGSEIGFGAYTGRLGIAGIIDQVRFFNKALTQQEVQAIYSESSYAKTTLPTVELDPFLDNSCKALYKFDNNALDAYGQYDGTATNVTYGTGKFGQCAVFNGISSQVVVPTLAPTMKSISFWASRDVVEAAFLAIVGGADESFIGFGQTSTTMRISINATVGIDLTVPTIVAGVMNHYCLVWTTATNIATYVNGTFVGNTSVGGYQTTAITYIGRRGTALWHKGKLDQLRIFNKALTPMEVASLYNETTPLEEPMHSLVDPFKDGSGKALYRLEGNALDESGNYNGTATSVTYGAGIAGRCGVFNGTSSIVTTAYNVLPNPSSVATISMWIKTSSNNAIVGMNDVSLLTKYFLIYPSGLMYGLSTDATTFTSIATNTWRHLVVVVKGSTLGATIYVDGQFVTNTPANSYAGSIQPIYYGGRNNGGTAQASTSGSIDQLRIFSRVLTEGEVQTLYTEGA